MVENINPAGDDSEHEYMALRLNTAWDVSDTTTVSTTLFYTEEEQGTDETVPTGVLDIDTIATVQSTSFSTDPGTGLYPDNRNKANRNAKESNDQESLVGIINVAHELNDQVTLKWITGFIDAELSRDFDQDQVYSDLFERHNEYEGFSWSTELRAEYVSDSAEFVIGVLYAQDDQDQENVVLAKDFTATFNGVGGFLPPFPRDLPLLNNKRNFEVESLAVFFDYTWHVNEKWDLIFGGRYTRDEITNDLDANGLAPTCCFPGSPGYEGPPGFDFYQSFISAPRPTVESEETFNDFAPRFVARYNINDDSNLYLSVSKGYKAGGTSVGNDTTNNDSPLEEKFDKETLWNYEIGLKAELWDNRLRLNAAVFQLEWDDMQLESFRFLLPPNDPEFLNSLYEETINVDEAEATGMELEFIAAITEGFTLSGGFGYLDSEIKSDTTAIITGGFEVDLKGLDIPKAPEFIANLSAEQRTGICLS
jgi:iron complex outermembrane receptor protein